jgi:hypothetical protein
MTRVPTISASALAARETRLRASLFRLLASQGFDVSDDLVVTDREYDKRQVRLVHSLSREERLAAEQPFIREWFPRLRKYLASGSDVIPEHVDPFPVVVDSGDDQMSALFRLASLWWSIPVSQGYGRRFRILVFDQSNDKLIGLLGLTDPVFNLGARDAWVKWPVRAREERLAHVMDAYVLGAVPPYNRLLGAKLVALLATSDFVRSVFKKRYSSSTSIILKREFDGRLALVTATSALGRSSIYNRLKFDEVDVFQPVGFTQGFGHFHLANGTYERLRQYLTLMGDDEVNRSKFGSGPNYRIRVVRRALQHLELPAGLLRHGIRRAVYVAPLAENTAAFLRGDNERLRWYGRPFADVVEAWRQRWLLPRASRDSSYKSFCMDTWEEILRGGAKS